MLKPVPQQGQMGCGVAAVAVILGVSYRSARAYFGLKGDDEHKGYSGTSLIEALGRAKIRYHLKQFGRLPIDKRWEAVSDRGIVCVQRWQNDRIKHYLVRDGAFWIDSLDHIGSSKKVSRESTWKGARTGHVWSRDALPDRYRPMSYLAPTPMGRIAEKRVSR